MVIGNTSKKKAHIFSQLAPRGILHRAFSVFLFDHEGKLLLQRRSDDKVTFRAVWTNTCCSHPLHGYNPTEVDTPDDVKSGSVMGVKRAAIRKLDQELGINPNKIDISRFKFLTRLHYWAADVVTHGPTSPWGEHEIDYILFYQLKEGEKIEMEPNPEEVDDVKWVTREQLLKQIDDFSLKEKNGSTLIWSPWFRIIVKRFLAPKWWKDLKRTLNTNDFVDGKIHRFDCSEEHFGGAGCAGAWLSLLKDPEDNKEEAKTAK
uniref:isopentenyl-diphosphate Delta-isomerase n=1 Tax=Amorphochlora amoebiformis TaxID=1561963 RepID=A0A7S0CWE4_9EUKA